MNTSSARRSLWRSSMFWALFLAAPIENEKEPVVEPQVTGSALTIKPVWMGVIALISIGLIAALLMKSPRLDWPVYQIDRAQAQEKAEFYLAEQGVSLEGEWHRTTTTHANWSQPLDYVWRESGQAVTQSLVGEYLDTAFWVVTWRKFDGPVEERAEQWQAWIYPDGRLHELVHQLPEGRAGAKLSREQALAKAMGWIIEKGWGDLNSLEEKSVEEILRPARSDWVITYLDKAAYDYEGARAAIVIKLAGDEITSYVRTIDIPDEWKRAQDEQASQRQPYNIIALVTTLALIGVALVAFFSRSANQQFDFIAALPWMAVVFIAHFGVSLLWIDPTLTGFLTTMGWWIQIGMMLFGSGVGASMVVVLVFLIAQAIHTERPRVDASVTSDFALGIVLALGVIGIKPLIQLIVTPSWTPVPYAADWATVAPWLTTILNGFKLLFPQLMLVILAVGFARFLTKPWRWALVIALGLVWLLCASFANREVVDAFIDRLGTAATVLLGFILIRRQQMGVVLAFMGGLIALRQLWIATAIYPGAIWHSLLSCAFCLGLFYLLLRHWYRRGCQ
jgi:hypothetical protein